MTKVLGIQNQRLAQCQYAKVILQSELPLQVDGEAWIQEAGAILVMHKNRSRMLVKDRAFTQTLESWSLKQSTSCGWAASPLFTTKLCEVLTADEVTGYKDMAASVRTLMQCIQKESSVNIDVSREVMPHVTTTGVCLDRVLPHGGHISETADLEHLQDLESNIKALVQETLWFLDMNKVSPDNEEELRCLVLNVEASINQVVAQNTTENLASRLQHRVSDTGEKQAAHRNRSTLVVDADIIRCSVETYKTIGKVVENWTSEDVSMWLTAIGLSNYIPTVVSHGITGPRLLVLRNEDMADLGIKKLVHQTSLRQAIQAIKSHQNSFLTDKTSTDS